MQYYDAIIISMFCNQNEYILEKNACEQTWGKHIPNNMLHIFYTSGKLNSNAKLVDNILYVPVEDTRAATYDKTIQAIKYIIENFDFKYLVKTNVSTYVNIEILKQVLDYKQINNDDSIYCNVLHLFNFGFMPRGDFNIIDRKWCVDMVNNYDLIKNIHPKQLADDYLMYWSLAIQYGKSFYTKYKTILNVDYTGVYSFNDLSHICGIRIKTLKNKSGKTISDTIKKLHNNIINEKNTFSFKPKFNTHKVKNRAVKQLKNNTLWIQYNYAVSSFINNKAFPPVNIIKNKSEYCRTLLSLIPTSCKIYHSCAYFPKQNLLKARDFWKNFDFSFKHNCYTKSPVLYTKYKLNQHHWTTTWCWNNIIPYLYKLMLNNEFPANEFNYVKHIIPNADLSYHDYNINEEFEFIDYNNNIHLTGNQSILRDINAKYRTESEITDYHRLFIGAHSVCRIINKTINTDNKLLINCDSMSIPIIPILSHFFKEILVLDNRTKNTFSNMIREFKPTHYLCLLISRSYYHSHRHMSNLK